MENKLIDLENIINNIEATIFSYESEHTKFLSPMKNLSHKNIKNIVILDGLIDF